MAAPSATPPHQWLAQRCHDEWMALQEKHLNDLFQVLQSNKKENDASLNFKSAIERTLKGFEDYVQRRMELCRRDVSGYFAPSWNTPLENSLIWCGGCRRSSYVRLVYALCGCQIESHLGELLRTDSSSSGGSLSSSLGNFSPTQFERISSSRIKTIKEEEKVTSRLASLQEDTADFPLAVIMISGAPSVTAFRDSQVITRDLNQALDKHDANMARVIEDADNLRLSTLKEMLDILTPSQGVEFLAASTKLHLSLHEWGKMRAQRNCHVAVAARRDGGGYGSSAGGTSGT